MKQKNQTSSQMPLFRVSSATQKVQDLRPLKLQAITGSAGDFIKSSMYEAKKTHFFTDATISSLQRDPKSANPKRLKLQGIATNFKALPKKTQIAKLKIASNCKE
jgi:hypothetical protein